MWLHRRERCILENSQTGDKEIFKSNHIPVTSSGRRFCKLTDGAV